MTPADRSPWPQRTTVVAGALLLLSGLLVLLVNARAGLAVTESFVVPLSGSVVSFAAGGARLAAFIVLALGVGGELGVAAHARLGKAALVIWGGRYLTFLLLYLVPIGDGAPAPAFIAALIAAQVLFVIAAIVSVVVVARARVLSGFARWVLLPVAVVEVVFVALSYPPLFATDAALAIQRWLVAWPTEFIDPALTLLVAVTLLLWGRTEALKHRATVIHDAW